MPWFNPSNLVGSATVSPLYPFLSVLRVSQRGIGQSVKRLFGTPRIGPGEMEDIG